MVAASHEPLTDGPGYRDHPVPSDFGPAGAAEYMRRTGCSATTVPEVVQMICQRLAERAAT